VARLLVGGEIKEGDAVSVEAKKGEISVRPG
jgi:hypothetical protein